MTHIITKKEIEELSKQIFPKMVKPEGYNQPVEMYFLPDIKKAIELGFNYQQKKKGGK